MSIEYPGTSSNILVGFVVERRNDPAQRGGYKVRSIFPAQGNNVKDEHLHYEPPMHSGNQLGVTTFPRPPEDGTVCYFYKDPTLGKLVMLGTEEASTISNSSSGGTPGNSPALMNFLKEAMEKKWGSQPPDIVKKVVRGAEIWEIKEKGEWYQKLVEGIVAQGGMPPLNGVFPKGISNIETAVQQFSNILSPSMISKLPGSTVNIGDIFNKIPSQIKDQIFNGLPKELSTGLQNMTNLIQNAESLSGSAFATLGKVDEETFLQNAIELFSDSAKINNMRDLLGVFRRLQSDTELFGLDKLGSVTQEFAGIFGGVPQTIDALGNVTNSANDVVQQAQAAFSSFLGGGGGGFPGGSGNFLDPKGAANIGEMLGRVDPKLAGVMKNVLSTVDVASVVNKFAKIGDPWGK